MHFDISLSCFILHLIVSYKNLALDIVVWVSDVTHEPFVKSFQIKRQQVTKEVIYTCKKAHRFVYNIINSYILTLKGLSFYYQINYVYISTLIFKPILLSFEASQRLL